ncbi:MAG: GerAB/ArcD/ProY family transporter [Bacillota bacterium]
MKLEGGKINNLHLMFLVAGFTIGSTSIISPTPGADHDSWLAIFAGLAEGLVFVAVFLTLAQKFPGKTLIEVNDIIYGKYLGKIISIGYLWFFLHLGSLVLRNFGDFFFVYVFLDTPLIVVLGFTIALTASAVRNGIEVIARCSIILVPLIVLAYILDTLFVIPQMDMNRLLPIMDVPLTDFIKASHAAATFPFGETVVFLMVIAFIKDDVKNTKKYFIFALVFVSFLFSMAAARNAAVLGATAQLDQYPSFVTISIIELGDIITRLEIIVVFTVFAMGFLKIAVCYYGTVLGYAQLLNMRSYLPLVVPIGIFMTVLSIIQFETVTENIEWAGSIYPFYSLLFEFFLPLLSLVLASFKQPPEGKEGNINEAGGR